MHGADALLVAFAGLGAGIVNGVAGGGSLVSFPALLAIGQPALVANVTSTVGIWPGYLGGVAGFRRELATQRARIRSLAPVALAGGLAGAVLLLVTPSDLFKAIAPYLILAACAMFALQPRVARKLAADRDPDVVRPDVPPAARYGTFLAGVYGGYFGAGLGVILLAVLGTVLSDPLIKVNGLRGVLALLVNSVALVVFALRADVDWVAAGLLAATSLVGGYAGAQLARTLPVPVLRAVVITFGLAAAAKLLLS